MAVPPAASLKSPEPASPPVADVTALTEPWPTELAAVTVAVAEPPGPLPSENRASANPAGRIGGQRIGARAGRIAPSQYARRVAAGADVAAGAAGGRLRQAQRTGRRAAYGVRQRNRSPVYVGRKVKRVVSVSARRRPGNNNRAAGRLAENSRTRSAVRQKCRAARAAVVTAVAADRAGRDVDRAAAADRRR